MGLKAWFVRVLLETPILLRGLEGVYTSYQWDHSSTGDPLTFGNDDYWLTTVSGFEPENLYSVNCSLRCKGNLMRLVSATVITGADCKLISQNIDKNMVEVQDGQNEFTQLVNEAGLYNSKSVRLGKNNNQSELMEVNVFPNPLGRGQNLTIFSPETEIEEVKLFDVNGTLRKQYVKVPLNGKLKLDEPLGTYILRIKAKDRVYTRRIIIAN